MRWTALLAPLIIATLSPAARAQAVAPDCPETPAEKAKARVLAKEWFGNDPRATDKLRDICLKHDIRHEWQLWR